MDSAAFKLIEQYDVIEGTWGKDIEVKRGSVMKDSDNRVLVGGVHKSRILRREKGFWLTVGPGDVIRVVKKFNAPVPEGDNAEAIKQKAISIIELAEDVADLA